MLDATWHKEKQNKQEMSQSASNKLAFKKPLAPNGIVTTVVLGKAGRE